MSNKNKAVFFDRDNTLIVDHVYLNDPDQITYLPGAVDCLRKIYHAGYKIIVVTNQSGVPRGLVELKNLREIHRRMAAHFHRHGVTIAGFYYAPFLPESGHFMRKPKPGMLREAAFDHNIDLAQSWMVGDRKTDVEAGQAAGTKTVFLCGTEPADFTGQPSPDGIARTLPEVAPIILKNK